MALDSNGKTRLVAPQYLRGIAALLVLLAHWGTVGRDPSAEVTRLHMVVASPSDAFNPLGYILWIWKVSVQAIPILNIEFASGGVLLFFLVSGFVIALSVEKLTTLEFAVRRAFRILPVLWAAIAVWLLLNAILTATGLAAGNPFNFNAIAANAFLVQDWYWIGNIDVAYWTLLVEVKFYVIMAGLVVVVGRISLPSVIVTALGIAVIGIAVSDIGQPSDFGALYDAGSWAFYTFQVLGGAAPFIVFMLMGTVLFLWYFRRCTFGQAASAIVALYGLFFAAYINSPHGVSSLHYVQTGASALAIFWSGIALERARIRWFRQIAPLGSLLNFFGNISFPLYLLHGLVGMSIIGAVHVWTGSLSVALLVASLIVFPLTYAIHRLIERPGQRLGVKVGRWLVGVHGVVRTVGASDGLDRHAGVIEGITGENAQPVRVESVEAGDVGRGIRHPPPSV